MLAGMALGIKSRDWAQAAGQDRYVRAGMALGIKSRDWAQAAGQVYSFKRRPSWALP